MTTATLELTAGTWQNIIRGLHTLAGVSGTDTLNSEQLTALANEIEELVIAQTN
jgi:HPt (histidine-containing phosphotransfer) domain-containing protein